VRPGDLFLPRWVDERDVYGDISVTNGLSPSYLAATVETRCGRNDAKTAQTKKVQLHKSQTYSRDIGTLG
jgi:hypothetical protein